MIFWCELEPEGKKWCTLRMVSACAAPPAARVSAAAAAADLNENEAM